MPASRSRPRAIDAETKLPKGMTCADCGHYDLCRSIITTHKLGGHEVRCDWTPSRFYLVPFLTRASA